MKEILFKLGFLKEEIESIISKYINKNKFVKIIELLKKYNVNTQCIKELILNYEHIFDMEVDRVEYTLISIISNGDLLEETILDIF